MAQILQFPERKEKVELERQMSETQESLTELYEAIRRIDQGFQAIQKSTLDLEDSNHLTSTFSAPTMSA